MRAIWHLSEDWLQTFGARYRELTEKGRSPCRHRLPRFLRRTDEAQEALIGKERRR
jgi:hypothetical protein